jgi:hypothetical protein
MTAPRRAASLVLIRSSGRTEISSVARGRVSAEEPVPAVVHLLGSEVFPVSAL